MFKKKVCPLKYQKFLPSGLGLNLDWGGPREEVDGDSEYPRFMGTKDYLGFALGERTNVGSNNKKQFCKLYINIRKEKQRKAFLSSGF